MRMNGGKVRQPRYCLLFSIRSSSFDLVAQLFSEIYDSRRRHSSSSSGGIRGGDEQWLLQVDATFPLPTLLPQKTESLIPSHSGLESWYHAFYYEGVTTKNSNYISFFFPTFFTASDVPFLAIMTSSNSSHLSALLKWTKYESRLL